MHVERAGELFGERLLRLSERVADEERLGRKRAVLELEDAEPVLALERDIDERQARMKIEMAWPEAHATAGRNRGAVGELSVLEGEDLERAGILGLVLLGVVAARDENGRRIVGRDADLMRIDARVERCRLLHLL